MYILKKWVIYFRKRLSRKRAVSRRTPVSQGAGLQSQQGPPLEGPAHFIPFPKR
jgi:hypothetical protein